MRLEPTPKPGHALRVSAKLVTSSTILHLSSDELEQAVIQELIENPALEVREQRVCLFCGSLMQGVQCISCGNFSQLGETTTFTSATLGNADEGLGEPLWSQGNENHQYDMDSYGWTESDEEDEFDPMARIPMGQTLSEVLLQQLETLTSPDDASIAEQLVGNLNERGYLEISPQEIAEQLAVPLERVAYVLSQLQTLEPPGIGARDLRECLLIQLHALGEHGDIQHLAATLIDRYLDRLGKSQFQEIARELKLPEQAVRQAAQYIRSTLNPYPAHSYTPDISASRTATAYMRPDVLIRKGENGYEVELIEEKRYHFRIGQGYHTQPLTHTMDARGSEIQRYVNHQSERARFFIDCIHRRWRTLKRVAELVIDYQREFLEKGVRALRPLTRAEVATRLNLDEGTVSRATANKYAMLPNGRLMPVSDFFDGSLGVKAILRELIASEQPRHRFSDDELARILSTRGIPMARRTVTKYREEMGIPSSRER
ncbi:MAG TPA: RNA polymerase factor sigma-54 [Ktedonobacteraceae bacterium]|nr:RNA polymerase factor sigma-54 [Ktedonobacteraceae bacterium]